MNRAIIVIPVQTPIVFKESRACSTAPVLTSLAMSAFSMWLQNLAKAMDLQLANSSKNNEIHYAKETCEH